MNHCATQLSRGAKPRAWACSGRARSLSALCRRAWLALLGVGLLAHAQFALTEFLASNASGMRDEEGAVSDWVELHNVSANDASLEGWFLTDSRTALTKWRLPATNIAADARLVVFASGKNRALPCAAHAII